MMPINEYVEVHNGGYYVAGTRIGLDVVIYDFRRGRSAEAIFEAILRSDLLPRFMAPSHSSLSTPLRLTRT